MAVTFYPNPFTTLDLSQVKDEAPESPFQPWLLENETFVELNCPSLKRKRPTREVDDLTLIVMLKKFHTASVTAKKMVKRMQELEAEISTLEEESREMQAKIERLRDSITPRKRHKGLC